MNKLQLFALMIGLGVSSNFLQGRVKPMMDEVKEVKNDKKAELYTKQIQTLTKQIENLGKKDSENIDKIRDLEDKLGKKVTQTQGYFARLGKSVQEMSFAQKFLAVTVSVVIAGGTEYAIRGESSTSKWLLGSVGDFISNNTPEGVKSRVGNAYDWASAKGKDAYQGAYQKMRSLGGYNNVQTNTGTNLPPRAPLSSPSVADDQDYSGFSARRSIGNMFNGRN